MKKKSPDNISFTRLQDTIHKIYDAAIDPDSWDAALASMCRTLYAEQGVMRTVNSNNRAVGSIRTHNKDPSWNKPYREYFNKIDPWLDMFLEADKTFYACTHHYLSDKAYEATELHADFIAPQNCHYGLGGLIKIDSTTKSYIVLHRDKSKNGFENSKLECFQLLGQHVKKSLLINQKVSDTDFEKKLIIDALNQINKPVMLVDEHGKVFFINHLAEKIIDRDSCLSIKKNILYAKNPDTNKNLKKIIYHAACKDTFSLNQQGGAIYLKSEISPSYLYILVTPVNPNMVNPHSSIPHCAMIFLSSSEQKTTFSSHSLQALYGFSAAEARLAARLSQGLTLDEIAAELSLSKNTLRTQLRACFAKTKVDRQASLINLIFNGPAANMG